MGAGAAFVAISILCGGTELPNNSQPADGQVLRERGEGTEEEVESVLQEYGERWDRRIRRGGRREGFDVGPGQVDVEEEEKGAEAGDGGLVVGVSVDFHRDVLRGERTSSWSSSSRERRLNKRCL